IKTTPDAGIKPPVLGIAYSFVQKRVAYESADAVTIPVAQLPNLQLDAPNYPTEIFAGDSLNLTMNLFNKGKSAIHNVMVVLEAEGLRAEESYFAGNMEPGVTKTYDVGVSVDPGVTGQISGNIVVTFEDNYGNETRRELPISVSVMEMDFGSEFAPEGGDMAAFEPEPQPGLPNWVYFAGGGALLAIAAIVTILVVRKRRKKEGAIDEME
ncbi:MAG: hypothetical protein LBU47_05440, partial [Christensenellaceae bacterium]|nr:hypothetical protein [Christensenellaceae bacterium]